MAKTSAELALILTANAASFNSALNNASKKFNDFGNKLTSVGKTLSVGLTLPLVAFGTKAVSEFQQTQQAIGQLEAGLRSTGNAVGYTSQQLQGMAKKLQGTSIFSDDEILRGVTDQLITFTNISGKAFEQAQQAALDLSSRLGQDLQSSAIQVGKALNDPIKGLTALGRVGVSFTESQKNTIKDMVALGNVAGAQKIILAELNKEFGGSAEAAAAASGGIKPMQRSLEDLAETAGGILAPYIKQVADYVRGLADKFQQLSPETQKLIVGIAAAAAAIGPLTIGVGYFAKTIIPLAKTGIESMKTALTALISPAGLVVAAIAAVAAAVYVGVKAYQQYTDNSTSASRAAANVAELEKKAAESIAKEKVELALLLNVAKDESASKEARQQAIQKLNALSPQYLGNLKLETINTQEATNAINQYNAALIQRAKAQAAEEKLVEIQRRILELEQKRADIQTNGTGKSIGILASQEVALKAIENTINDLNNESTLLTQTITDNSGAFAKDEAAIVKTTAALNDFNSAAGKINRKPSAEGLAPIASVGTDNLSLGGPAPISKLFTGFQSIDAPEVLSLQDQINAKLKESTDAAEKAKEKYIELGQAISESFQQQGTTLKEYLSNVLRALANVIRKIIKVFIAEAVAGWAAKTLSTLGPAGVALAAAAPGIVGGIFDSIIPAFAQGGMVTGPTLAMVGDNPSGKEAIIPFERMKEFMGSFGGNQPQQVYITGVLRGSDIALAVSQSNVNNTRQFGQNLKF